MSLPVFENYAPKHLSFSTVNSYRDCGMRTKLQKVLKIEQRPLIAGIGGNALHAATEWYDLYQEGGYDPEVDTTDPGTMFRKAWDEEIEKRAKESPSFNLEDYIVTGKASAAYGGKRGIEWWMDNGPQMVQRWIDWRQNGWSIWETPEGRPAVEVELNIVLPGDTPVLMFIDRIMVTPAGQICPVDLKSGRTPDTPEQLGLYATGIELTWGKELRPDWGFWWDANKGTHSSPLALGMYTPDYFGGVYAEAVRGINAGVFLARPANACFNWCGTAHACPANPNASFLQ